jgi:hypothetical protein
MTKKIDIYILIDPLSQVVRYVGQSKDSSVRFRTLLSSARSNEPWNLRLKVNQWIRTLLNARHKPEMRVIDFADTRAEAAVKERWWIDCFNSLGCNILVTKKSTLVGG